MSTDETAGESVVAKIFDEVNEATTKDEVAASTIHENFLLKKVLANMSVVIDDLIAKIAQLEKEKEESIPKSCIKELLENAFKSGKIPIPSNFGRVVEVVSSNITFTLNLGLSADVTFVDPKRSLVILFQLSPIPYDSFDTKEYFPDFHIGYTKITPIKKRVKKKVVIIKDGTTPFPPTGNPS